MILEFLNKVGLKLMGAGAMKYYAGNLLLRAAVATVFGFVVIVPFSGLIPGVPPLFPAVSLWLQWITGAVVAALVMPRDHDAARGREG